MATQIKTEVAESIRTIRPTFDKILIERDQEREVTANGVIIPEISQEKTLRGTVIACGEGRLTPDGQLVPIHFEPGERVLFGLYAGLKVPDTAADGQPIDVEKSRLLMVREDEILGVWE